MVARLVVNERNWTDARDYCISLDMRLMEVRSDSDFEAAQDVRRELGQVMWLGGSHNEAEGAWVWESDGSAINMTRFWHPDRPKDDNRKYLALNRYFNLVDSKGEATRKFACVYND